MSKSQQLHAYFGHHKCGTVWITNIFNAVCKTVGWTVKHAHSPEMFDYDIGRNQGREGFNALTYTNANFRYIEGVNVLGFHVVRDPRDIIVSGYYSHLHSHPENVWPELRIYRPLLKRVGKAEGLMMEMEFASDWMADLRSWPTNSPNILLIQFEDLIRDPFAIFSRAFRHLGIFNTKLDENQLVEIIDRFSYEKMSEGRRPGQEDISSHFRKGVPGDWINHFAPEHVWMFKHRYNDILIKYGYERDENWQGGLNVKPTLTMAEKFRLFRSTRLVQLHTLRRRIFP